MLKCRQISKRRSLYPPFFDRIPRTDIGGQEPARRLSRLFAGVNMSAMRIGFLTVLGDEDNHSQMMSGVFERAEKSGASVIRFAVRENSGNYSETSEELDKMCQVIAMQHLDGLLFLGWMPGLIGPFFAPFLERFKDLPKVCLGVRTDLVENVYADSENQIEELIEHLILDHGRKNIVYVPPAYPDGRIKRYIKAMKSHGIYREELLIDAALLEGVPMDRRMAKVASILFDERKLEVDAFYVTFDSDAQGLYAELKRRNLSVPAKVSVVSNEDSEFARFSFPPMTVVTFPWREVGYAGCQKLVQMIEGTPYVFSSGVPGKVIIRGSCGCRSDSEKFAGIESHRLGRAENEGDYAGIGSITESMRALYPSSPLRIEALLEALVCDFTYDSALSFLKEFEDQVSEIIAKYPMRSSVDETEDFLYSLRSHLLPLLWGRTRDIVRLDDILLKCLVVVRENFVAINAHENIEVRKIDRRVHYLGQELTGAFSLSNLARILERSLPEIQIRSGYIFLAEDGSFDKLRLLVACSEERPCQIEDEVYPLYDLIGTLLRAHKRLLCQFLRIDNTFMGLAIFEPSVLDARIYETLTLHLSSAVRGALLHESLNREMALRREKEKLLLHGANYDTLTDVYNRRSFERTLRIFTTPGDEHPSLPFYLVYVDFDDFKKVNDTYGHDVGDLLIIEISKRFRQTVRPYSCVLPQEVRGEDDSADSEAVFRLGGDEFTALVCGISDENMRMLAARLIQIVRSPYQINGDELQISCSIGVSRFPDDANSPEQLVKLADTAMYCAKESKDMYVFYGDMPISTGEERV